MKKIFNFLKTFLYSIWPAIAGACVVLDTHHIIKNIRAISTSSGWSVVWSFVMAVIGIILVLLLLYELGTIQLNSNKWVAHKKAIDAQTIDSSTSDCETSDDAADK
jgi:hypothetical protein